MKNNPHERIGTFCDKCRNVICNCNKNKFYTGFKKADLIHGVDGWFICLNDIPVEKDTITFFRNFSLVKLLVFNFKVVCNLNEELLLFEKENPVIKDFSDNESLQFIRKHGYDFHWYLRNKYGISKIMDITPCV